MPSVREPVFVNPSVTKVETRFSVIFDPVNDVEMNFFANVTESFYVSIDNLNVVVAIDSFSQSLQESMNFFAFGSRLECEVETV